MAWSWSHTQEAYDNARANLGMLDLATLREIRAEWLAYAPDADDADSEGFSIEAHTGEHNSPTGEDLTAAELAEEIWQRASEAATCDNGGFNAWMCPFGCHTVSFDEPANTYRAANGEAERFAWPGGYERAAVMDDGDTLCVPCVNDATNPVHDMSGLLVTSDKIRASLADGWGIVGWTHVGESDDPMTCAHCGREIS